MLGWVRVSAICVLGLSAFGLFANLMASYDLNSHGPSWTGTWYISDAAPSHLARSILDAAEGMFPVYDKTLGLVVPHWTQINGGHLWDAVLYFALVLGSVFVIRGAPWKRAFFDVSLLAFSIATVYGAGIWFFDPAFWYGVVISPQNVAPWKYIFGTPNPDVPQASTFAWFSVADFFVVCLVMVFVLLLVRRSMRATA